MSDDLWIERGRSVDLNSGLDSGLVGSVNWAGPAEPVGPADAGEDGVDLVDACADDVCNFVEAVERVGRGADGAIELPRDTSGVERCRACFGGRTGPRLAELCINGGMAVGDGGAVCAGREAAAAVMPLNGLDSESTRGRSVIMAVEREFGTVAADWLLLLRCKGLASREGGGACRFDERLVLCGAVWDPSRLARGRKMFQGISQSVQGARLGLNFSRARRTQPIPQGLLYIGGRRGSAEGN